MMMMTGRSPDTPAPAQQYVTTAAQDERDEPADVGQSTDAGGTQPAGACSCMGLEVSRILSLFFFQGLSVSGGRQQNNANLLVPNLVNSGSVTIQVSVESYWHIVKHASFG